MIRQIFGQIGHTEDDEVEMVVVRCPRPRWRPRGLLGHNPLNQTVSAVWECRTVLTNGAMDETQVLEQHQFTVRVQSVECFVSAAKTR